MHHQSAHLSVLVPAGDELVGDVGCVVAGHVRHAVQDEDHVRPGDHLNNQLTSKCSSMISLTVSSCSHMVCTEAVEMAGLSQITT